MLGFICNLLVRPVAERHFMSDEELAVEKRLATSSQTTRTLSAPPAGASIGFHPQPVAILLSWLAVGIPLAYGIWITLQQAAKLFL